MAFAGLAAGCSSDDGPYFGTTRRTGKEPTAFYYNNSTEPDIIDPGRASDSASGSIAAQLFEGLTVADPRDQHPTQGVAERWEKSPDNRLYRFHLRANAKWSDGVPVTARDFEYAWKRVLRPSTASQAATNLYSLMNAEAFNLGRIKLTKAAITTTPLAIPGAVGTKLAKGAAVIVLGRSPRAITTSVAPLASPKDVRGTSLTKGASEELAFDDGTKVTASGAGWKGAEVEIIGVGADVQCNAEGDHWFQVQRGNERGWLPGCALGDIKGKATALVVAEHTRLPIYMPREEMPPLSTTPIGTLPEDAVVEDDSVLGVHARDDRTLEVELERPAPYFLDQTGVPTAAPVRRDVIERFGTGDLWTRPENIVVNGPYTIDSWRFRYEIVMKPNPFWWNRDKLKLTKVVALAVEEMNSAMRLYKAGDIDFSGDNSSLPSEYQRTLQQKKDFQRTFFLSTYWFELNTKVPPTDDVRVRRALDAAIDKRQIVEKVTRGGQIPATHYVPDFTGLGYKEQVEEDRKAGTDPFGMPGSDFDPERARALLREAGYKIEKDGDGYRAVGFPSLELLYNTSEGHKQIAVAVQDMWRRHLGIAVTLRNEEWRVMLKNIRDGHYQVARFGWIADYNHPATFLDTFLSTAPQNLTHWGSAEFDAEMRRAATLADTKQSIQAYRNAEKIALEGMARIPMYFYTKSVLVKPWLKGFWGLPRGAHLAQFLWIDPEGTAENVPAYAPLELGPPMPFEGP